MDKTQYLLRHFAACHPLVMMGAQDEVRAAAGISSAIDALQRRLIEAPREATAFRDVLAMYWSATDGIALWPPPFLDGLVAPAGEGAQKIFGRLFGSKEKELRGTAVLSKALDVIHSMARPGSEAASVLDEADCRVIVILFDAGTYITKVGDYPRAQRKVRDIAQLLRNGSCLLTVDPEATVPSSLRSLASVIRWGLPGSDETMDYLVSARVPGADAEGNAEACAGLHLPQARLAASLAATQTAGLTPQGILRHKKQILAASAEHVTIMEPQGSLSDVGGLDLLKRWLRDRDRIFSEEARQFGIPNPKGILFLGPPGSGKSLLAKTVGAQWQMAILQLDMGRLQNRYLGVTEQRLRETLEVAQTMAPCILWIDEIEKAFGTGTNGSETSSRVLGTFLTWMQENNAGVFLVATANDVSKLPPELLRTGRFDETFWVGFPNEVDCKEILEVHLRKRGRDPSEFALDDHARLAAKKHLTGAEIEYAVVSALVDAFSSGKDDITDSDLAVGISRQTAVFDTYSDRLAVVEEWANTGGLKRASSERSLAANAQQKDKPRASGVITVDDDKEAKSGQRRSRRRYRRSSRRGDG